MTIPEPSYITEAEVKANTLITGLSQLENPDVKKLIQRAESQIDRHVRRQKHHLYDTNIDRVFPREEDYLITSDASGPIHYPETPQIPLEVSEACLAQVEYLFTQWWSTRTTTQTPVEREVESENIGGDGSYSAEYGAMTSSSDELCQQAKSKLEAFVSRSTNMSVPDPDIVLPPRWLSSRY